MAFGFPSGLGLLSALRPVRTSEWIPPSQGVSRVMVVSWDLLFHTQERGGRNCVQGGRGLSEENSRVRRGFFLPALLKLLGHHGQKQGWKSGSPDPLVPRGLPREKSPTHGCRSSQRPSTAFPTLSSLYTRDMGRKKFLLGLCPPGQSSLLAGATDDYNFSFPIIP